MPDPTTTNLVLAVPTRGSDAGTWDTPVNGDMAILDACAGNVTTKSLSNVNVTLSTTESQVSILRLTGTITGTVVVTLGAITKSWIVENNTINPGFLLRITGSPGTGNSIMPPPGSSQIYWDGTNMSFINLPPGIGCYEDYAGTGIPSWVSSCTVPPFLLCDGSTFSAVTYPLLNAILGSTTLPDHRARVRVPLDGGTGRLTTSGGGVDGATRFATGGAQNVTLTISTMPNHGHGISDPGHAHGGIDDAPSKVGQFSAGGSNGWAGNSVVNTGSAATGVSVVATGGDGAHFNVQPIIVGGITMIRAA